MQKIIYSLIFFIFALSGQGQDLSGNYFALELNSLSIDTSGDVYFYMHEVFPKERWLYEVNIVIKDTTITIDKYPVYFDSLNKKWYSASDGGFLTYKGVLTRFNDLYIAKTKLIDCDYIGLSIYKPPKNQDDTMKQEQIDLTKFEIYDDSHGHQLYFPNGTITQDFILRPDKDGVWINNKLFYRRKKKIS
jgi:hypothetical protein